MAQETPKSSAALKELLAMVRAIDARVIDLTAPSDLLLIDQFQEIRKRWAYFRGAAETLLTDPGCTEQQRIVVALSIQSKDEAECLSFATRMLVLLTEARISQTLFRFAAFPSYDMNPTLALAYRQPAVHDFLESVVRAPEVDYRLREIVRDYYLTGKAKSWVTTFAKAMP
jgi:hypothetical protein